MAKEPTILKFSAVVDRVRAYQTKMASEKAAGATQVSETDPNEKGVVSIPTDAEASKTKQNMPKDNTNASSEGSKIEDKDTNPHSTGKDKVTTTDGTVKDEAACGGDPTKPLSKIAARATAIMDRLKQAGTTEKPVVSTTTTAAKSAASGTDTNTSIAQDISADPEFLFKLATTILETEGGISAVEPILRKAAGVEAAQELIAKATNAYQTLVEEGYQELALRKQAAEQHLYIEQALESMLKNASADDKDKIVKLAKIHDEAMNEYAHPMLKQAYMQGAEDAAAMTDSMGGGAPAEGGGTEGGGGPMIPGGGEGPASIEEIIQLLDLMVQSGEIDQETAMAVAQQLMGEGGAPAEGGGMEGGGAPAEGGAEAAPVEATPAEEAIPEEAKAASIKSLFNELVTKSTK
jgi:hypothetical protein